MRFPKILSTLLAGAVLALGMTAALPETAHAQAITKGRKASDGKAVSLDLSDGGVLRVNESAPTLFASALRTAATYNSADQTNYSARGVTIFIDITAEGGATMTLDAKVQIKDPVSGQYFDLTGAAFAQFTAVGKDYLTVYPGVAESANETVSDVIPLTWRLVVTVAADSATFSVGANYTQ